MHSYPLKNKFITKNPHDSIYITKLPTLFYWHFTHCCLIRNLSLQINKIFATTETMINHFVRNHGCNSPRLCKVVFDITTRHDTYNMPINIEK